MDIRNVNASKSWLVTKSSCHSSLEAQFLDSRVNVTCESWLYLEAAATIATQGGSYIEGKVQEWFAVVLLLAKVAESQPHAALTHGNWYFLFRIIPEFMQLLEDVLGFHSSC